MTNKTQTIKPNNLRLLSFFATPFDARIIAYVEKKDENLSNIIIRNPKTTNTIFNRERLKKTISVASALDIAGLFDNTL